MKSFVEKVNKKKMQKEMNRYFSIQIWKQNNGNKICFWNATVFNLQNLLNKLMLNENYYKPVQDHLLFLLSSPFLRTYTWIWSACEWCNLNELGETRKKEGNKQAAQNQEVCCSNLTWQVIQYHTVVCSLLLFQVGWGIGKSK